MLLNLPYFIVTLIKMNVFMHFTVLNVKLVGHRSYSKVGAFSTSLIKILLKQLKAVTL